MNNIELLLIALPIFVAGVATVLAFLFIVVYYYFLMLACEFLALVTGVIVSSHVMACIMFFEHLVFSDVVILFVFFSLDVFFLYASRCFCCSLFFLKFSNDFVRAFLIRNVRGCGWEE